MLREFWGEGLAGFAGFVIPFLIGWGCVRGVRFVSVLGASFAGNRPTNRRALILGRDFFLELRIRFAARLGLHIRFSALFPFAHHYPEASDHK